MMSTTQQAADPEAFTYDDAVSFVRRRFQGRAPKPEQGAPEEEEEPEWAAPEEAGPMWPEDMPEFIDGVPRHLHFPAAIAACADMQAFLQDTTSPQVRAFSQALISVTDSAFTLTQRLRVQLDAQPDANAAMLSSRSHSLAAWHSAVCRRCLNPQGPKHELNPVRR